MCYTDPLMYGLAMIDMIFFIFLVFVLFVSGSSLPAC